MSTETMNAGETLQVPSTPPRDKDSLRASVSSMTPPPSTQPARFRSPVGVPSMRLSSPQPTGPRPEAVNPLPTPEKITAASIEELRTMAQDLVGAISDARMSAAHFKLQHTLLTMETQEAAQRAEVEQQMARREVEVLQAAEQRHRAVTSLTPKPSPQPQILSLSQTCTELREELEDAERELESMNKLLEFERDRAERLMEENILLKRRIRENREHFTQLKDSSPLYQTPRHPYTTPRRKSYSRFADSTPAEPFSALLYADQILSQETATVPSTPTKSQPNKVKQGHVRGAHSLSSLQTTPSWQPLTNEGLAAHRLSDPNSQHRDHSSERHRHDRDSTISVSDENESDDVGQSQASSLATNMLRKNPASQESIRQSQEAQNSSSLLQNKLFGNVSKAGSLRSTTGKRNRDVSNDYIQAKKAKLAKGVGLGVGIESWDQETS